MDPNPRIARRDLQAQVRGGRRSRKGDRSGEEACAGCWQQVISGKWLKKEGYNRSLRETSSDGGPRDVCGWKIISFSLSLIFGGYPQRDRSSELYI